MFHALPSLAKNFLPKASPHPPPDCPPAPAPVAEGTGARVHTSTRFRKKLAEDPSLLKLLGCQNTCESPPPSPPPASPPSKPPPVLPPHPIFSVGGYSYYVAPWRSPYGYVYTPGTDTWTQDASLHLPAESQSAYGWGEGATAAVDAGYLYIKVGYP